MEPMFFGYQQPKPGMLVSAELSKAIEDCRRSVERISIDCRATNRRFRDHDFDVELDKQRCLYGLAPTLPFNPSDVQRVTQIFDEPRFFIPGSDCSEIVQGGLGDCYFISALSLVHTGKLSDKLCVARDEKVGVYGFVFFRDSIWVSVIIDDLLYTHLPKFEQLTYREKQIYHHDKESYNESARKNGNALYFASSGTDGETWIPLAEKAYAKLHGSYAALAGGRTSEAVEDMTGGVSTDIITKDILDEETFWNQELKKANVDRMFGCLLRTSPDPRPGVNPELAPQGLLGNHSYSVLRTVEYKGKRFVILRNPWGESRWEGPWSDGSKEWTSEWLAALPHLRYSFGDDGEFVMEYKDFLECWDLVEKTLLFDPSWIMAYHWVHVKTRPFPSAHSFGDVSFSFSLSQPSPIVLALSQLDTRYFAGIASLYRWNLDFVLYQKGFKEHIARSTRSDYGRSVNLELGFLPAGEYVVHVRLDRKHGPITEAQQEQNLAHWEKRTLSRSLTERAIGQSVARNFDQTSERLHLPTPLGILAGQSIAELEAKARNTTGLKEERARRGPEAKAYSWFGLFWFFIALPGRVIHSETFEVMLTMLGLEWIAWLFLVLAKDKAVKPSGPPASKDASDELEMGGDMQPYSPEDSIFVGLRVYSAGDAPVAGLRADLRHHSELYLSPSLAL